MLDNLLTAFRAECKADRSFLAVQMKKCHLLVLCPIFPRSWRKLIVVNPKILFLSSLPESMRANGRGWAEIVTLYCLGISKFKLIGTGVESLLFDFTLYNDFLRAASFGALGSAWADNVAYVDNNVLVGTWLAWDLRLWTHFNDSSCPKFGPWLWGFRPCLSVPSGSSMRRPSQL